MTSRIPHHLKGKGLASGYSPPPRKRIQAPSLDTTELIEANSLTLIGRLTNPSCQRLWALFPFLSNRWNLRGKALGSDLGRGCFQFKFDFAEDMQKVLDNRPYHFDQWMIILQKWEPIISDNFPYSIPFWIDIQGLPKHYWQPEMLHSIGENLGEIMDLEITSVAVKLRVLLDGLQPLLKECVVDFPDGSEALISLEYKSLKSHCLHCQRLTHETKSCPGLRSSKDVTKDKSPIPVSPQHASKVTSRNYYTPRDNFRAPSNISQRSERNYPPLKDSHRTKNRHLPAASRSSSHSATRTFSQVQRKHRDDPIRLSHSSRGEFSRDHSNYKTSRRGYEQQRPRQNQQWREKTPSPSGQYREISDSSRTRRPPLERTFEEVAPPTPPPIPTTEEVMGELREVTLQYTNCADPTESAARKRRVLQSEAQNLMAETASQMIEAATRANQSALELRKQSLNGTLEETHESLSIPPGFSPPSAAPAKKKRGRPPLNKSQPKGPLNLTGAKSSKRNRYTVQSSPKRKPTPEKNLNSDAGTSRNPRKNPSKSPATNTGPKINIIPAVVKKKVDFQDPPNSLP